MCSSVPLAWPPRDWPTLLTDVKDKQTRKNETKRCKKFANGSLLSRYGSAGLLHNRSELVIEGDHRT